MNQSTETPGERRERYLLHAAEAEMAPLRCGDGTIRAAYVHIAKSWIALANEFCATRNDLVKMASDGRRSDQESDSATDTPHSQAKAATPVE